MLLIVISSGIMFLSNPPKELDLTEDGFDIQWGTNVLGKCLHIHDNVQQTNLLFEGPFYFTKLLMPALISAAQSSEDKKARVTFTASIVQSKGIKFDTLTDTPARKKMSADQRYGQSKFVSISIYFLLQLLFDTNIFCFPQGKRSSRSRVCKALWRQRHRCNISESW